ncbi:hypothetical protein AVEN_243567-2 [Araneus ventricosus]|uniref:Uncharacterized protein n=1 Tax=Araneus ventricosus TaxID=182803 RepID=A0A4Y2A5H8_ARAVE|nr:hypothetical protein AVEN_243567-1 [Araneus ventricosus]GBL74680.1 hypothetical protein AVEN_243567-2 [Araneus ventricosus]
MSWSQWSTLQGAWHGVVHQVTDFNCSFVTVVPTAGRISEQRQTSVIQLCIEAAVFLSVVLHRPHPVFEADHPDHRTPTIMHSGYIPKSFCNIAERKSTFSLLKSFEYFRSGNMYKALHYANKSIAFNPDNIQARVTRGTVYANLGKMKKAFIDTEDSLKLDPKHESASKQMSELLVAASKTYLLHGNYFSWHESLVLAKKYNSNNREAQELLTKSKYETCASTSVNPGPVTMLIPPSMADVSPIYNRVFPQVDKRRLLKQYRKQRKRKRKHHRRRRSERRKSQQRASSVGQPIPITTTRRQVFLRPGSPVFRRPFPPRSINPRS